MMSRLSIFSSDTLQTPVKRIIFQPAFVSTISVLLVFELGLRLLIPSDHLPTGSWHNAELRDQAKQLEAMSEVDLMITGSSVAAVNLRPAVIDAVLKENGVNINSFNAGIRGCDYSCIGTLFPQLFISRKTPDYAMLVIAPRDLNEANAFTTDRSQKFLKTFSMEKYAANLVDILSYSWIFGFRNEIREYIKQRKWLYDKSKITEQGHIQLGDKKAKRYKLEFKIDPNGSIANALYILTDSLLAQGIKIIVLPGLFDSDTRSLIDAETWQNYSNILNRLAEKDNVALLDVYHLVPADEHFIDRDHLNTTASADYSEVIGQYLYRLGFPWKSAAERGHALANF